MVLNEIKAANNPYLEVYKDGRITDIPVRIAGVGLNMKISSYYMKIETIKFTNRKDLNLLDKRYKEYNVNLVCEDNSTLYKWENVRVAVTYKNGNKVFIVLSRKNEAKSFERRKHRRYRIEENVIMNLNGSFSKTNPPFGTALDISQTGMAIFCSDLGYIQGQELEITFYGIKRPLKAKIVRKVDKQFTDKTTLGLQFKRGLYQYLAVRKIIKRR